MLAPSLRSGSLLHEAELFRVPLEIRAIGVLLIHEIDAILLQPCLIESIVLTELIICDIVQSLKSESVLACDLNEIPLDGRILPILH